MNFFKKIGPRKTYVAGELFFAYLAQGITMIMLGSVLPQLRDAYQLDYSVSGTLLSVQSIGFLAVGLFTGALAVRIGLKRAYLLLYALCPIGLIMLLLNGNPLWLIAAMLLIGLTKGAITDYNNRIMGDYAEGSAAPLNLLHAFYAIGACLAPLIVLLCCGSDSGWRLAILIAIAVSALSLLTGGFMRLDPLEQTAASTASGFGFVHDRLFWQTTAIGFFYQAVEASAIGWVTSFYVDSGVMEESSAQLVTSALWLALLIGRFSCSAIATKFRPYQMLLVMSIGMAAFLGLLVTGHSLPILLTATLGLGLCMSGMYGTSVSNANPVFAQYPLCMGLYVTLIGIGGTLAPIAVGLIADASGIRIGMTVLLVAALLLVLSAIINLRYFTKKQSAS